MASLTIQDRAYLMMHLHAIKYHQFDCFGLLIGSKNNKTVEVTDSIPLFHQRVLTGTCETAFEMVSSLFLKEGQSIVGLYEAALPSSLVGGKEQSSLAQYMCEQI